MSAICRRWLILGSLIGALGVGLGAFGAHTLPDLLAKLGYAGDDVTRRLALFETAIRYQMFNAIAIVLVGLASEYRDTRSWRAAGWLFLFGTIVFCGLLKVMTLASTQWNWLGAIVPFGGVAMIFGWVALAIGAVNAKSAK